MNIKVCWLILGLAATVSGRYVSAEERGVPEKESRNEAEIRKSVESYVAAFNRGDAKAVAAQWSEAGDYVTPAGERLHGRQAIESYFEAFFKDNQGVRVEVGNPAIRFITSDVAVEEGTVWVLAPNAAPSESSYLAIHVQHKDRWLVESIRETAVPAESPARSAELDQLAWMVGDWIDSSGESTVETKVSWTKNKAFLVCSFRVDVPGLDDLEGTQVIGWDAAAGMIRSWVFDSDGAVMQGTWTHKENHWVVKMTGVLADGATASSTNVYTTVDSGTYKWRSFGRKVGDDPLPDIDEVTVVRKSTAESGDHAARKRMSKPTKPAASKEKP